MSARYLKQSAIAAVLSVPCCASFAGTGTCTIVIVNTGTMRPNATLTTLSSANAGGMDAQVRYSTQPGTGFYSLTAPPPTSFDLSPPGGNTNVSFGTFYITGLGTTPTTGSLSIQGSNVNVAVRLTATKTSGSFGAGTYRATFTTRCE